MSETAGSPIAGVELLNHLEPNLLDRHKNHLCDALARLYFVAIATAIPA